MEQVVGELLLWASVSIFGLTLLLLCIRPAGRLGFFIVSLLASAALNWTIGDRDLHGEGIVFVCLPLLPAIAAILAEVIFRIWRLARRSAPRPQPE